VGIAQTDLSGRFTYANESYQQMVGRSLEQLRQLTMMDITHPEDLPQNLLLLGRLKEAGQRFEIEKRYLKPDGTILWIHNSVSQVTQAEGQPCHILAVCQEVTQKKQAEQALQASEQQLRLIANNLPVLISFVDEQERYQFVNHTYQEWFGEPIARLQGKTLREVIGQAAYEAILPRVRNVLAGKEQHFESQINYHGVGIRYVEARYIPHRLAGQVIGFYALVTDITSRKQNEQALEQAVTETGLANQRLSRINADLDSFVYTASHDLRSPIATMQGLVNLIQMRLADQLPTRDQMLLQYLATSMNKLNRTIQDLSEIVQASTNTGQQAEAIRLEDLYLEVKEDLAPLLESSKAEILTEWGVDAIHYPRKVLRSVLFNLLSNAVKYRHPDREASIRLKTERTEGLLHLSVADNGLGLTAQQVGQLFKLFGRLHTHVEGTGIGLYTIKRMVENYGGNISVESNPGEGTVFRVFFPFVADKVPAWQKE
jgi:PAS domain S-box-containing protein